MWGNTVIMMNKDMSNGFEVGIFFFISLGDNHVLVKFIYSEKATKFFKISTLDLFYVVPVKSTVEISQKGLA